MFNPQSSEAGEWVSCVNHIEARRLPCCRMLARKKNGYESKDDSRPECHSPERGSADHWDSGLRVYGLPVVGCMRLTFGNPYTNSVLREIRCVL